MGSVRFTLFLRAPCQVLDSADTATAVCTKRIIKVCVHRSCLLYGITATALAVQNAAQFARQLCGMHHTRLSFDTSARGNRGE
jgi:hypothetical protein